MSMIIVVESSNAWNLSTAGIHLEMLKSVTSATSKVTQPMSPKPTELLHLQKLNPERIS